MGGGIESRATVLLVDDDEERMRQARALLETAGNRVITAVDGAAGLRLVAAHDCDVVLCELQLPDMDGLDVCRAIKRAAATRDLPVVMLIDTDDPVPRDKALTAGADETIGRPFGDATLSAVVRSQVQIRRLRSQVDALEAVVLTLSRAVEDRDQASAGMSEKVAHWASELGRGAGLTAEQVTSLYKAALLHDVGAVGVPVTILTKPGRLEPSEFDAVKQHPIVGEEIVRPLPDSEHLVPAVRHHHERIDGAGYPDGIGGETIPLFARIIAIADAFVAITSDRAYRPRRSKDEAIRILQQGAGKQWDPELVEGFVRLLRRATSQEPTTRSVG